MVIKQQSFDSGVSRRKEMAHLWRILAHFAIPKDILLYSEDEIERWRHCTNHIIARALSEGKVLYERQ